MQENKEIQLRKNLIVVGHAVNRFHDGNRRAGRMFSKPEANPFAFFRRAVDLGSVINYQITNKRNVCVLRSILEYAGFHFVLEHSNDIARVITMMPIPKKINWKKPRQKKFTEKEKYGFLTEI